MLVTVDAAAAELTRFREQLPAVLRALPQMKGDAAVIGKVLRHVEAAPQGK